MTRRTLSILMAALIPLVIFGAVISRDAHRRLRWEEIAAKTDFSSRDSAIAFVHQNRMWLMGGWLGLRLPTPTDIWSSSDGVHWKEVMSAAPWRNGDAAMALSFKGEIWLVGGVSDPRQGDETFSNEIWSSVDGETWTYHGHAAWSPRAGAALVTFGDKLWLSGGFDGKTYNSEVWSSSNGTDWVLETAAAPWSARAFHAAVNFHDAIWLMGGGVWGGDGVFPNDVWRSRDGRTWEKVEDSAPWRGRLWSSAVVYDDAIWLIGGRYGSDLDSRSIWHTADGRNWDRVPGPAGYSRRHAAATYAYNNRIWIVGGYEGGGKGGNDVWTFRNVDR